MRTTRSAGCCCGKPDMSALRAPVLAAGLAAALALLTGCVPADETTPSPSTTAAAQPSADATSLPVPSQSPKAAKKKKNDGAPGAREDHTDPASIGVVVNKRRPLPRWTTTPTTCASPRSASGPAASPPCCATPWQTPPRRCSARLRPTARPWSWSADSVPMPPRWTPTTTGSSSTEARPPRT